MTYSYKMVPDISTSCNGSPSCCAVTNQLIIYADNPLQLAIEGETVIARFYQWENARRPWPLGFTWEQIGARLARWATQRHARLHAPPVPVQSTQIDFLFEKAKSWDT